MSLFDNTVFSVQSLKVNLLIYIFLIQSIQLIAKGVKDLNVGATEQSPVHGLEELGAALPKPQVPLKPGTPVISMTSALKEVGVVGTFAKRVKLMGTPTP